MPNPKKTTVKSGITNSHFIGVQDFYIALLNKDEPGSAAEYGEMIHLPEIIKIGMTPQTKEATLYADNHAVDAAKSTGEYKIALDMAVVPMEYRALLLGHKLEKGELVASSDDAPPFVGIAFVATKSNGTKRLTKFLKCRFAEPTDEAETKGENIKFNTPKMEGTAIFRTTDKLVYKILDEEAEGTTPEAVEAFFKTFEAVV